MEKIYFIGEWPTYVLSWRGILCICVCVYICEGKHMPEMRHKNRHWVHILATREHRGMLCGHPQTSHSFLHGALKNINLTTELALVGSCLKTGQHLIFFNYIFITADIYIFFDSVSKILFKIFMYKSQRFYLIMILISSINKVSSIRVLFFLYD